MICMIPNKHFQYILPQIFMPRTWLTSSNSSFIKLIHSIILFLLVQYPPQISYKNIPSHAMQSLCESGEYTPFKYKSSTTPYIYYEITDKNCWNIENKENTVVSIWWGKIQQYFRFAREQFVQVFCCAEEDCCLSSWNPAKLFGKHSSLVSYSGLPIQFCTKLPPESLHGVF